MQSTIFTILLTIIAAIFSSEWLPHYASSVITNLFTSSSPEATLNTYYTKLNRKEFSSAYDTFSDNLKNKKSLESLVDDAKDGFYNIISISEVYTSNDFAIRKITLNTSKGTRSNQWVGPIYLKRNNFHWKIYRQNELCRKSRQKGNKTCYKSSN